GNVLMVNLSPVQALQQVRNQRSFVSDMLHWDMTLMPRGTRSKWSWNSTCDRFDLIVLPDALDPEHRIDTVDRFLFRDRELGNIMPKTLSGDKPPGQRRSSLRRDARDRHGFDAFARVLHGFYARKRPSKRGLDAQQRATNH